MAHIETETVRAVKKSAFISESEIDDMACKFVGAPEGTAVVVEQREVTLADGTLKQVTGYALSWDHVAKPRAPRAPRKPKTVAAV